MISKAFANKINAEIFGGQEYTTPAVWYFGLSTKAITDGVIPVDGEPTNAGYSRARLTNDQHLRFQHIILYIRLVLCLIRLLLVCQKLLAAIKLQSHISFYPVVQQVHPVKYGETLQMQES